MTSGNTIVDAVTNLNIKAIPDTWYSRIRKNDKPNAMAILMLWDIIYWYKATEVKDEATDRVIGLKKKFKDKDFLQRNYQQLADKYGISKKIATTLTDDLEEIGVIKKHFRTVDINGIKCSNVMFIEVVPSVLAYISSYEGYTPDGIGGIDEQGDTSTPEGKSSYDEQGDTNTNNYSNTYSNTYSNIPATPDTELGTPDFNDSAPTNKLNTVKSKKVPSSPSPKAKKESKTFKREDYLACMSIFGENKQRLKANGKTVDNSEFPFSYFQRVLKKWFTEYGVDKVKDGLRNSVNNQYLVNHGYKATALFSDSIFPQCVANSKPINNGTSYQKKQPFFVDKERVYDKSEDGRF